MCDIRIERFRINKILNQAIEDGFGHWAMKSDELVHHCFLALQYYYHGLCVDECLRVKAEEFVDSYLASRKTDEAAATLRRSKAA
ncbi:MAG: hypothetical protein WDN46_22200 [Methylocella sp.]